MRILITGGSGFVGGYLVDALMARPESLEVIVGTYRTAAAPRNGVKSVALDVTDAEQVCDVVAAEKPTHIFHLAGIAQTAYADIRRTWDVNFGGVLNVAIAIKEIVPECRLICCTSAEIYGDSCRFGEPIGEDSVLDPIIPYGASKAAADILVGQMAKQGLKAIRLRPFNHIGPGQSEGFVVSTFAAQLARIERGQQEPVMRVGNLSVRRDFLDVRDVVDAYVRAIYRFDQLPVGCALNIASGRAITIESILQMLLSLCPVSVEVIVDQQRLRASESRISVGDASRARALLDWVPAIEILQSLKTILDWYRQHYKLASMPVRSSA